MKQSEKIQWRNQIIVVLRDLLKKNEISEEFVKCEMDCEFFDDSYHFLELRHGIFELMETLKAINKYEALLEQ